MKKEQWIELTNTYKSNTVEIHSEYNKEFIAGIKALKGFWDADIKTWIVKKDRINEVRELASKVYGLNQYNTKSITTKKEGMPLEKIPEKMNITYYELSASEDTFWRAGKHYLPEGTEITFTYA